MKKILILSLAFAPVISLAAGLATVLTTISGLFTAVLPILISLAVIYFIWALIRYILKAGEEQAEARQQMIWGVIILFVMVSVWGLVNLLGDTLNLNETAPTIDLSPTIN